MKNNMWLFSSALGKLHLDLTTGMKQTSAFKIIILRVGRSWPKSSRNPDRNRIFLHSAGKR